MKEMEKRYAWLVGAFKIRGKHTHGKEGRKAGREEGGEGLFMGTCQECDKGWERDKGHIPVSLYVPC